ncbi:MAG: hypothetical protein EPN86_04165 [Nanoarchaeota archaeon]|nr:MAG: hypothetical protein EPN86_04165 [Nanoarchaeota archaeon]
MSELVEILNSIRNLSDIEVGIVTSVISYCAGAHNTLRNSESVVKNEYIEVGYDGICVPAFLGTTASAITQRSFEPSLLLILPASGISYLVGRIAGGVFAMNEYWLSD